MISFNNHSDNLQQKLGVRIAILESRIDQIKKAIIDMRKAATPETVKNVEIAISMLALPELEKVQAELRELLLD